MPWRSLFDGVRVTQMLTVPEVAPIIRKSRRQAYRLAREGALPGLVTIGKRYLVNLSTLEAALRGHDVQPVAS